QLILPAVEGGSVVLGVGGLADTGTVCSCNHLSNARICASLAHRAPAPGARKSCTRAGTTCGGCVPLVTELLKDELRKAGVEVRNTLCEHFAYSRQELFDIVRVHRIVSFSELLASHGTG